LLTDGAINFHHLTGHYLTPNLLRLADAPAEQKNRAGFDRPGFASEVQNVVCQKTRG